MWLSSVVLPLPRNPVITWGWWVIDHRLGMMGMGLVPQWGGGMGRRHWSCMHAGAPQCTCALVRIGLWKQQLGGAHIRLGVCLGACDGGGAHGALPFACDETWCQARAG